MMQGALYLYMPVMVRQVTEVYEACHLRGKEFMKDWRVQLTWVVMLISCLAGAGAPRGRRGRLRGW